MNFVKPKWINQFVPNIKHDLVSKLIVCVSGKGKKERSYKNGERERDYKYIIEDKWW